MSEAQSRVLITHDVGLHARPSVKLTKLAKGFHSRIEAEHRTARAGQRR
jgi:phosphocarrier protein HPr